jgi:hypothetical protein
MIETHVSDWSGSKWYDFYDPKFKIDADKAIVNLTAALSEGMMNSTLPLVRKNQKWQILKQEPLF